MKDLTKPLQRLIWMMILVSASSGMPVFSQSSHIYREASGQVIKPGAWQTEAYFPLLTGKRVAVTANHTSLVGKVHLVDTLISSKIQVVKVFSPEHGFRGNAPDGETIHNQQDQKTGLPIISLYGSKKKPSPEDLAGVDIILFDIQDVGVRFYTYISTMTYVMEAAAKEGIPVIVLDRPNPNGHYIDGPILERQYQSFVGLHPVPVVYGMTIGEYALMVNGEGWLEGNVRCQLQVIPIQGYDHNTLYNLPVPPSPNLPSMAAIYLYPSLAFFEGTFMSIGRGTDYPFQVIGHPELKDASFRFKPRSIPLASKNPPLLGIECKGYLLQDFGQHFAWRNRSIYLFWLLESYRQLGHLQGFFTSYFDKLAGTSRLREMIIAGKSEAEIRQTWKEGIETFKKIRSKYLLYPDFEL